MKPLYLIITVSIAAIGAVIALNVGSSQKTVPKVKLSYFTDSVEFAGAITQRLQQEITAEKNFWYGIEPEKKNHLELAFAVLKDLEKMNGPFDIKILDKELELQVDAYPELKDYQVLQVKKNWYEVADIFQKNKDKKIFVLTASIYSTSFLKDNPFHKIKLQSGAQAISFSSGYFSIDTADEKNQLFRCSTENKEGVADWACAMINKSRTLRRKFDPAKTKTAGLMDLTGEKDYMILLR